MRSNIEELSSFDRVELLEQPDGLRALLRPYQRAGLSWLNLLCDLRIGGILADDMGLGKTVQILALLQHRIVNQPDLTPQTILVVCPKSVQAHWFAQANNLVPRLKCHMLSPRDMLKEYRFKEHVLLLVSYGLVRHNIETFSRKKFDLLIIDGDQFHNCASNKLEYLCQQIPELINNGHRIVVFSQFLGFLRSLSKGMQTLEIRHSYVDGETPAREREIALFQSNPAIKVLLISLRIGGIGIDLTSSDVCIIADPWWNDAVEKQAIDRLHRFGQKKSVTVLRLISAGSIEEKMEVLKWNKSELVDALGKTSPDFLNHLKWEDFTEIF